MAMSGAQQIEKKDAPELWRVVENLAIASGMPMPKVYIRVDKEKFAEACRAFVVDNDLLRETAAAFRLLPGFVLFGRYRLGDYPWK